VGDPEDDALVASLGAWRERHMAVYPTQFQVTAAGTRTWLRELVLGVPDRLMLLVLRGDRVVGHLGLCDAFAADGSASLSNVVVGERAAMPPGAMQACEEALLAWAYDTLGVTCVWAGIYMDNLASLGLHRKLGFAAQEAIAMRRHALPGGRVEYRACAPGDDGAPDRVQTWFVHRRDVR
jgi:RimJ/RimL family protein N-acetyltransferase